MSAEKYSIYSYFVGVGKGLVGLVSRPVTGVLDATAITLTTVQKTADGVEIVTRVRPPRHLPAEGSIRPYNLEEAEGSEVLIQVENGRFAAEDFRAQARVLVHQKSGSSYTGVFIVTGKSLVLAKRSTLLSSWSADWAVQINALRDVQAVKSTLIVILNVSLASKYHVCKKMKKGIQYGT